jgi:hypothetical protein
MSRWWMSKGRVRRVGGDDGDGDGGWEIWSLIKFAAATTTRTSSSSLVCLLPETQENGGETEGSFLWGEREMYSF